MIPEEILHINCEGQGIPKPPKAREKPNDVFLKAMGLLGFALSMVKFTVISTLQEGEDTILASGGEGCLY